MAFNKSEVSKLLARCHRRCCICHKLCGVKMETNHIDPKEGDDIDNAIPLCLECHAEVGHYNTKHPIGRKYTNEELKLHRKQWLNICESNPQIFSAVPERDVGPLEGMIMELDHNMQVAKLAKKTQSDLEVGASLKLIQYERAISEGSLMILPTELKKNITDAYLAIDKAQSFNDTRISIGPIGSAYHEATSKLVKALRDSIPTIKTALNNLKKHLKLEGDD